MGDAALLPEPEAPGPARFPEEWTVFARSFEATLGCTMETGASTPAPPCSAGRRWSCTSARPGTAPGAGAVRGATLNPARRLDFDVVIPPAGRGILDSHEDENIKVGVRAAMLEVFPVHKLSVPVGRGRTEGFEWRHTFGEEVGDLIGGGPAAGWKLVRTDLRSVAVGVPASDGREVVAVWVDGRKNLKEALRFRFLNSGAPDALGDTVIALDMQQLCLHWECGIMQGAKARKVPITVAGKPSSFRGYLGNA